MGAALYVVLEKPVPGLTLQLDGKRLSQASHSLDKAALSLGVPPLMEFFSSNPEEAEEFGFECEEQWFSADQGLATVTALLGAPQSEPAREDLLALQHILQEAHKHGIRWHLAVDY